MVGTILNRRFYLESEIRRASAGPIYRAIDGELRRRVSIQILEVSRCPVERRRLLAEALVISRLCHVNVVRLYDVGEVEGMIYLIYEDMTFPSIKRKGVKAPVHTRVRASERVVSALGYAHSQGVVHGNVKPSNILLGSEKLVKLAGFGLGFVRTRAQSQGLALGSPAYMSPEQAQGQVFDHRADVYSMGVVLYELISGSPPFVGATEELMAMHVQQNAAPLRSIVPLLSVEAEELVQNMLEKDPGAGPARSPRLKPCCCLCSSTTRCCAILCKHRPSLPTSSSGSPRPQAIRRRPKTPKMIPI